MKGNDEKKRFAVAMFWLAEQFPLGRDVAGKPKPRELTKKMLENWFEALGDLHICRVEAGIKRHFAHEDFWPSSAGNLRKSCNAVSMPRDGWLPPPPRPLLPEMPLSQQRENMRKVSEMLNELSGGKTAFAVGDDGKLKAGSGRKK